MSLVPPSLVVSGDIQVARRRTLNAAAEVLVKPGDRVAATDLVARTRVPGRVLSIPIARLLGCPAAKISSAVKVRPGQAAAAGDTLASWRTLMTSASVRAPESGVVERISTTTGSLWLRTEAQDVSVTAYLDGTVLEVIPAHGAVVGTVATLVQGVWGAGPETNGRLIVAVDRPDHDLDPSDIGEAWQGAIVVAGRSLSPSLVGAARRFGIRGLIAGSCRASDWPNMPAPDITLFVTEGFGRIPLSNKAFDVLGAAAGRLASACGATRIRAGAVRPEVIIATSDGRVPGDPGMAALRPDALVRIVAGGLLGRIGRVVDLPETPAWIPSGAVVPVVVVALDRGEPVRIPAANVEVLS